MNRLLKADKDRAKPKQPPPYSLPPKVLADPLFQPLVTYYMGFGLDDCPPPPYGAAPADPIDAVPLGDCPVDALKTKGQDVKRHMAYIQKKIDEAIAKRMGYFEQLQTALAKAKKLDKKLLPNSKITSELEESKKQVKACDKDSQISMFSFGDMELPVMRITLVIDASNGSKASIPEVKEEILQFISNEVTEHAYAFNVIYVANKEPVAFKPYLIKDWNSETIAALNKWMKNLKAAPTCLAGTSNITAAIEMALTMEPSILILATTHGLTESEAKDSLLDLLSRRCPPGSALQGDDEEESEDDEQIENLDDEEDFKENRTEKEDDVQHDDEEEEEGELDVEKPQIVAAECKPNETERSLLREMGVDFRVLRLECKMTDEIVNGEVSDFLRQCCEAALGPDAIPEDIEACVSMMSRGNLWKSSMANVKKTQKLRKKKVQLDSFSSDAQSNLEGIHPLRLLLHGQLAVERTLNFDLVRCQMAMWQPVVKPVEAPVKGAKGGAQSSKANKPGSAENEASRPNSKDSKLKQKVVEEDAGRGDADTEENKNNMASNGFEEKIDSREEANVSRGRQ